MPNMPQPDLPICIAGAGLTGMTSAFALAKSGFKINLLALANPLTTTTTNIHDQRTTAIFNHSVNWLKTIGLWPKIKAKAYPIKALRIIDVSDRLLRAPEITFKAEEIGQANFGFNLANEHIITALTDVLATNDAVRIIEGKFSDFSELRQRVKVWFKSPESQQESMMAAIIVGADGHRSKVRTQAGIKATTTNYQQKAMVFNIHHQNNHANMVTEFHGEYGPLTFVPMADNMASVVWVSSPGHIGNLMRATKSYVAAELSKTSNNLLGKIDIATNPQAFAISRITVDQLAQRRCFLLGDAGHGLPPIGAQGFNLGIRDIIEFTELLRHASDNNKDIGDYIVTDRYNARRKPDIVSRTIAVSMLNNSLVSNNILSQITKTGIINCLQKQSLIRKLIINCGIYPPFLRKIN